MWTAHKPSECKKGATANNDNNNRTGSITTANNNNTTQNTSIQETLIAPYHQAAPNLEDNEDEE